MEVARQSAIKVIWNSKDVTSDISKYASSISYTDVEEGMSDDATLVFDNTDGRWFEDWYPNEGDTLELYLGYNNKLLNCGLFEVDEITLSGLPDQIEIKTIAAGMTKALRTRNSKAFENQTLHQIAKYFCSKHNLTLVDSTSMLNQINLDRKTQENQTDLSFLAQLSKDYGFIFSIRGNKLIFTSYYDLDNADSIKEIDKTEIGSYSITRKMYDTYAVSEFKARDHKKGKLVESSVTADDEDWDGTAVDTYKAYGADKSAQSSKAKVQSKLWDKNKMKQTCSLTGLEGDPELVSGINFDLTGCGLGSGKYHIISSTHTISGDGAYVMSLECRKTGTVPKPKRVPKKETETIEETDSLGEYE